MAGENGQSEVTALEKRIIRQVEYYFGDMNLPKDKFLQEKIKEDDGWVSMDVMLNFNRLKCLSNDKDAICTALRKSSTGLIEVDETSTKIRRSPLKPLPDNTKERKDDIQARSVYVKGFPQDATLDLLLEFFEQHGKIDNLFMRRKAKNDKTFKGSVMVVFSNRDEEDKFLAIQELQYNDVSLIKMTKEEYFKKKSEEIKQRKLGNDTLKAQEKKAEEDKTLQEKITKGAVLFMKGLPAETKLEDIKGFFEKFGKVAWVEFNQGEDKALVRFGEGNAQSVREKALEAGEGKIVIKEAELETRILEGEEELEYWRKMFRDLAERSNRRRNQQSQSRKRKGGFKSRKGYEKGSHGGDEDGEPKSKAMKKDDKSPSVQDEAESCEPQAMEIKTEDAKNTPVNSEKYETSAVEIKTGTDGVKQEND